MNLSIININNNVLYLKLLYFAKNNLKYNIMVLSEQINNDIKQAMKDKNKVKLEALRAVKSELLLLKTAGGSSDSLSTEMEIKVIQKLIKQRKDSAEIYKTSGRDELYNTEIAQITFLEAYLPEQMNDEELTKLISSIIEQTQASSIKDMGKVMGIASKQLAGKADGKTISSKVKELFNK